MEIISMNLIICYSKFSENVCHAMNKSYVHDVTANLQRALLGRLESAR